MFTEQKKLLKRQYSLDNNSSISSSSSNTSSCSSENTKTTSNFSILPKKFSCHKRSFSSSSFSISLKLAVGATVSNCGSSVKSVSEEEQKNKKTSNNASSKKKLSNTSNKRRSKGSNTLHFTPSSKNENISSVEILTENSLSLSPNLNSNMFNLNNLSNTTGYYVPPYNHYATYLPQSSSNNVKSSSLQNTNKHKAKSKSDVKRSKSLSGSINLSLAPKSKTPLQNMKKIIKS